MSIYGIPDGQNPQPVVTDYSAIDELLNSRAEFVAENAKLLGDPAVAAYLGNDSFVRPDEAPAGETAQDAPNTPTKKRRRKPGGAAKRGGWVGGRTNGTGNRLEVMAENKNAEVSATVANRMFDNRRSERLDDSKERRDDNQWGRRQDVKVDEKLVDNKYRGRKSAETEGLMVSGVEARNSVAPDIGGGKEDTTRALGQWEESHEKLGAASALEGAQIESAMDNFDPGEGVEHADKWVKDLLAGKVSAVDDGGELHKNIKARFEADQAAGVYDKDGKQVDHKGREDRNADYSYSFHRDYNERK